MTAEQTEPWVSMKDVQEHLGVRRETIAGWIAHRDMPAFKVGRFWRFKLSEVDEWVRTQSTNDKKTDAVAAQGDDECQN